MGLADYHAAKRDAALAALHAELEAAVLEPEPAPPQPGLTIAEVDPFKGRDRELRGIPLVGAGGGAMPGTRPGDGIRLNKAGRELVRGHVQRTRRRDHA